MTIRQDGRRTRKRVSALRRTASLLLVSLLLSLVGVVSGGGTAWATIGTNDYPYASIGGGPNTNSAWADSSGSVSSPYGFYYRNCTDFVAWRLNNDNKFTGLPHGIGTGATSWGDWAKSQQPAGTYPVNSTPAAGAVAWWAANTLDDNVSVGSFGHVAYVDSVNGDGSVNIEEYNWYIKGVFDGAWHQRTITPGTSTQQVQFIHFKDLPTTPTYTHANIAWDQGGTLFQLSGQTSGAFSVAGSTAGISSATWVAGGYFRANGKPQVVSYSASTGTLTEFEWTGSSWAWVNNTTGIGSPDWAVVGNFSGNGHDGLAWDQGGTLYYLSGQSDGTFSIGGSTTGIYSATWVGAGGFRNDGKAQVASYSASTGTLTEFEWTGSSWAWVNNTTGIGSPDWAVTGDFNNTGHSGIAWDQGGTLFQLSGQTDGTFSLGGSTAGIGPATWVGAGDFRADGKAEIVSYSAATGTITEFESTGSSFAWVSNTTGIGVPDWAVTNGSDK